MPSTGSAIAAYGGKENKNADWILAYWDKIKLMIGVKRKALIADITKPINKRGMYDGIKRAISPIPAKSVSVMSKTGMTIIDRAMQMQRGRNTFFVLYAVANVVTDTAFNSILELPAMVELDYVPTEEKLSKAIDRLISEKLLKMMATMVYATAIEESLSLVLLVKCLLVYSSLFHTFLWTPNAVSELEN
ncbi:hypothetical protein HELRODRAFT_172721 [Helobdella robusta]|uniref:Uncharacterized protein n=1 Tax=Helobdella robusta TaxID=6412 RepID=T1F5U7_HELRO|nr:hypothetical protein HELRODRAFT_172721 [Helobdella robusta]ESO04355.1 hypothetical protein HELRODRAFT_172721 [Helobdella robusta]